MATKKAEPKITTAEAEELLFGRVHLNDAFNALVEERKALAEAIKELSKRLQAETKELKALIEEIEL
jgi:hypothetical protein